MNVMLRLVRLGLIALLAVSAVGCCIVPPRGWGHGPRDYSGYAQPEPMHGRSRGGDNQRMGPDGQRR